MKIWKRPSVRRPGRFCGGRKRTVLGKMRKNYIMKKIVSLLLALTMALGLAACGGAASSSVASSAAASSEAFS